MDEGSIWLKAVGTAEHRLPQLWLGERTKLMKEVRFPPRVPTVREGDYFVYYASGWQKIFAAGEFTSDPVWAEAKGEERWPWRAGVRLFLIVPDLKLAPHLTRADIDTYSVRSKSHIRLTDHQYREAVAGLAEAAGFEDERYAALAG